MSEQPRSWTVYSGEVEKWLSRSPTELIKEMREFGSVSSAAKEILSRMPIPDGATAQITLIPVEQGVVQTEVDTPPLWVAPAIFLDRHKWIERMMALGVWRIVVMHPVQETTAGKGRLAVWFDFRDRVGPDGELEQEVVWEISLTFVGGEDLKAARLAQAYDEASFFGVPVSQLGRKIVPQMGASQALTA